MAENIVRHRRPIDSGVSVGSSNETDEKLNEDMTGDVTDDEDIVFNEPSEAEKKKEDFNAKQQSNALIAVKERLLGTANLFLTGGKLFALALAIWLIGYFGFSFLWLGIGVFVYVWRDNRRKNKAATSRVLDIIAKDEKKYFQTVKDIYKMSGKDFPSWVYFPDIEKAEWINKVMQQMWPFVTDFVKSIIVEKVEPAIQSSNSLLSGFTFSKVDLGDKSPRVAGVKVYSNGQTRRTEIVIDLQIIYTSDANIRLTVNRLSAGIKNLSLSGLLRVELRPLISQIPLAGAVSIAFVQQPSIDFDLTDLGNIFDLPGIDSTLRTAISDCVNTMLVLPEKYILKLCDDVDISRLQYPLPKGVVRIHIIEARNLEEKDRKIMGIGGGSDPFVEVKVGREQEFRTEIISHNINPTWNEIFDAMVMDIHTSSIEITLYDDDGALTAADYLGSASIQMMSVYNEGVIDEWIPLSNVDSGKIHVRIEWLELSNNPNSIIEAMECAGKHDMNSALLSIYVDSAKDLPLNRPSETTGISFDKVEGFMDGRYEPSPRVRVMVPGFTKPFKTKVAENTNNPVWEENFRALIQNPRMESLTFQVKSSKSISVKKILGKVTKTVSRSRRRRSTIQDGDSKEEMLGTVKIRIKDLLKSSDMTIEEPCNLLNSGPRSKLSLRVTARLLLPRKTKLDRSGSDKSAFVIAKPKPSATTFSETIANTDTSVIKEDTPDKAEEATEMSVSDEGVGSSLERPASTPSEGSTNSAGLGIDFVDKTLALFVGRSPSKSSSSVNLGDSNKPDGRNSMNNNNTVTSTSNESSLGRLNLTLTYSSEKQKLFVDVNKAENLVICDKDNNTSDPYVKMYLLPDRRSSFKRKTKVVKNSINPVFSERLEYEMLKGDLGKHQLEISVKNKTGLLSSEKVLMGLVLIDLSNYNLLEGHVNDWFPLKVDSSQEE